jgi:hypothetical protein
MFKLKLKMKRCCTFYNSAHPGWLSSPLKKGQAAINKVSDHTMFLECFAVSVGITVTNIWRTQPFSWPSSKRIVVMLKNMVLYR